MAKNYIPDIDLTLENFPAFIAARRELMLARYSEILKTELESI